MNSSADKLLNLTFRRWSQIMSDVKIRDQGIHALLQSTRPGLVDGKQIVLEVDHEFAHSKLSESRIKSVIEDVFQNVLEQQCSIDFHLRSSQQKEKKDNLKIYLAGRILPDDWRFKILDWHQFPDLGCVEFIEGIRWPVLDKAIFGIHDYTGPFFESRKPHEWCGINHVHSWELMDSNVSSPPDGCITTVSRFKIKSRCLDAIDRSDAVFAWLDDTRAYGTLVEIGYAIASSKIVWVASSIAEIANDLWFAAVAADWHYFNFPPDPKEALKCVLKESGYLVEPSPCESPIEQMFWDIAEARIDGLVPQVEVGSYRVDFAVPNLRIAIELDGHDYHKTKEQRTHDAQRERFLQTNGWNVIRFTGSEVYRDAKFCVDQAFNIIETIVRNRAEGYV